MHRQILHRQNLFSIELQMPASLQNCLQSSSARPWRQTVTVEQPARMIPPNAGHDPKHHSTSSGRRGFTLVELLVVMAIIAMLAAIVGPKLFPKLGKGKQSAAKAQIELLGQALDQFRLDTARYPTGQEGLQALMVNPGIQSWDGPYLKKNLPNDPWGRAYHYSCPGTHGEYDLLSYGRDNAPGGEGEDKDIVSWD